MTTPVNTTPSNNQAFEVQEKLAQLEEMLTSKVPNISVLLRDIHRTLKQDPDVVTILSEEECSILVRGLKKKTNTNISTGAIKKAKNKKPMSKMTVADL